MHSLPIFVRLTGRPVILLGAGDAAAAKARLLRRAGAAIVGEDAPAALAIVAIDDDAAAEAAIARLKVRGVLVNAVDRADRCDFTLPAIVDRDPVLLAIGTGGASAGLAAALRQRLEALLPANLGRVATALANARTLLRARHPDGGVRRQAIGRLLGPGGMLDLLIDHPDPVVSTSEHEPDRIERVHVTSADPEELTLRAARLLGQADRLYHPPGVAAAILDRARADAVRIAGAAPSSPLPGLSVELLAVELPPLEPIGS